MGQGTVHEAANGQRLGPQHMRRLRALHEGLTRDFAAALSTLLRTPTEVSLAGLDQRTYGQYMGEIETPACFYLLMADPLDDRAMLDIEPAILQPMIDRLLGGAGEAEPPWGRPLTEIELCLTSRIVRMFLQECCSAWKSVLDLRLDVLQVEDNPRLLRILPADELVMLARLEITAGPRRGALRFCLPCRAIQRIGDRLSSEPLPSLARPLPMSLADVRVTLAETQITAGQLADLRVGDIIATETAVDSPATVSIDGAAAFLAKPGVYQGRRAVRLTENLSAETNRRSGE
jgi:flagellar motor switch protein FliM